MPTYMVIEMADVFAMPRADWQEALREVYDFITNGATTPTLPQEVGRGRGTFALIEVRESLRLPTDQSRIELLDLSDDAEQPEIPF